ncbi:hypothetical protein FJT64_016747 [Amphibalanus amphitrite]|uniref:WSC domain-containing protein n=1 Tax=Amphibalanus amphitrite TaxID=1232801 RepID=A0A6A4WZI9_AMPAM|nr:hypothetical protein FJT64_016747 [Amphibalanus amphitrite]
MTRSPSVCFKRCAAGSFNYAFYSVDVGGSSDRALPEVGASCRLDVPIAIRRRHGCSCLGPAEVDAVRSDTSSSPDGASPDSTIQIIQLGSLQGSAFPKDLLVLDRTSSGDQWSFSPRWITISIRLGAGSQGSLELEGQTRSVSGFNIRGRLRISRDAGFFTSDLSQLSGQWQTVDAERNAECPQKCLEAGFSYAAMQTQTKRTYGQNIGIASNPASCFKGCATSNFNYAFYTVYGCLCSNDKSDVKVVRPRYRSLKYFAAGRTSLFYIGRVNRLKPSGRVQTGRFMAASLLQSQAWRRLPAVPPLFCLQMCALRGYTYAAVGSSEDPGSLPSGDWRDLGQQPVSDCLAACARHNLLFMAVRVQGDTTACWGAPAADLSSLQHSAPDVAGMYQLFSLDGLRVGQKSHFSYGGIVNVISESLANGYERFSIVMKDSQPSPLVSYFTDTVPGSVRWLPTTFLDSAAQCVARCCGLRFSLALVRSSNDRLCLCGDLRAGSDLGLTDTSPPSSAGSMQVVRLPPPPPPAEPDSSVDDGEADTQKMCSKQVVQIKL